MVQCICYCKRNRAREREIIGAILDGYGSVTIPRGAEAVAILDAPDLQTALDEYLKGLTFEPDKPKLEIVS